MARLTLARIVRVVAEEFGETPDRITGPSRAIHLATPRHVVWGIAGKTGRFTGGQLAAAFDRDMSTVKVGVARLPRKLATPAIAAKVVRVCERLAVDPRLLGLEPTVPVIARLVPSISVAASFAREVSA